MKIKHLQLVHGMTVVLTGNDLRSVNEDQASGG